MSAAMAAATASGVSPASTRFAASTRTSPQSWAVPRIDGAAAEDAGGERALERLRVGVVGHARGDRGGREAMLGDGDEEQVEKEALLVGRLLAGHQEEEELGEGHPPHQVARQVAAADQDAVRIRGAERRFRLSRLADQHEDSSIAASIMSAAPL